MRSTVPKAVEKKLAAQAVEALGLLTVIKPLCKRGGGLTVEEQRVMVDALSAVNRVINDAMNSYWEEIQKPDTSARFEPMAQPKGASYEHVDHPLRQARPDPHRAAQ